MLRHFRLIPFLVGLAVGIFLVFFYVAPKVTVYKYPHPQTVESAVYRDTNGICYKYASKEVDCDGNEGTLKPYPLQG